MSHNAWKIFWISTIFLTKTIIQARLAHKAEQKEPQYCWLYGSNLLHKRKSCWSKMNGNEINTIENNKEVGANYTFKIRKLWRCSTVVQYYNVQNNTELEFYINYLIPIHCHFRLRFHQSFIVQKSRMCGHYTTIQRNHYHRHIAHTSYSTLLNIPNFLNTIQKFHFPQYYTTKSYFILTFFCDSNYKYLFTEKNLRISKNKNNHLQGGKVPNDCMWNTDLKNQTGPNHFDMPT